MAATSQYKTKQGEELLAFLRSAPHTHITASDIRAHFQGQGVSMGLATIYRHLDKLVEGGLVNKYTSPSSNGSYFEYINREENCSHSTCFHCKCRGCGQLIHLKCNELEGVQSHLLNKHGFSLDPVHTVLYGTCDTCRSTISQ